MNSERSNVIPFPNRNSVRPAATRARSKRAATPARAKRQLLTPDQYKAARVLAHIIAGGYGGALDSHPGGKHHGYYLTVAADERTRLRERLIGLAAHLNLDPEPFIRPFLFKRRGHTGEHPTWPHTVFVACIKRLHQQRREGRPDELAERLALALTADAQQHEAASRSYRPDPTPEPQPESERGRKLREARTTIGDVLRKLLLRASTEEECTFIEGLIDKYESPQAAAPGEDWPDYIDTGDAA